jgi:hypothetical protein
MQRGIPNREGDLHATEQVALHPVGAGAVQSLELLLLALRFSVAVATPYPPEAGLHAVRDAEATQDFRHQNIHMAGSFPACGLTGIAVATLRLVPPSRPPL